MAENKEKNGVYWVFLFIQCTIQENLIVEKSSENGTVFRNYKSELNVTWNKTKQGSKIRLGTSNFGGFEENNVGLLYPKPAKPDCMTFRHTAASK